MDASIDHLHVRYIGVADTLPGAARARLDDVIRHRSLDHMETALEEALAGDNAVYILRRVRTALVLNLETASGDDLAGRMGTHLASAAMLALARGEGNTENLIRFRSQAEYVARFVTDLARADDCEKWYYMPLRDLAALTSSAEIETALFRNAEFLPAILTCLQESGDLPSVLRALHPSAVESLWSRSHRKTCAAESFRPLFRAALDLLPSNDAGTNEADFEAWLMTRPPAPDWQDRSSLTAAVEAMLRFLAARHPIEPQSPVNAESALARMDWLDTAVLRDAVKDVFETANLPRIVMGLVLDALPRASTSFTRLTEVGPTPLPARENIIAEYLASASRPLTSDLRVALIDAIRFLQTRGYISGVEDVERLKAKLPELQVNLSQQQSTVLPLRPISPKPTPAHCELLSDIRSLLDEHPEYLPADKTASTAIRLYAALIAAYPRWGQSDAPSGMVANAIERVLEGAPDDVVVERPAASRSKETNSAPTESEAAFFANRIVAAYSPGEVESACAGVFLLLRAVLDSRLGALSTTLKYPACSHEFSVLLASLALRWSGAEGCRDDGRLDPGIIALAGPDAPRTLAELADAWKFTDPVDHARFSYGLLKMLSDHRLFAGTELHLCRLPYQGASATVANSEVSGLWPLASLHASESTIAEWITQLTDATGNTPAIFTSEALPFGWEAFEKGTLGMPDADLALTIIANALVRLWARWLRRFADSSASYLLTNFIRRPGLISESPDGLVVRMSRGPLDLILDMTGYSRDLDSVPDVLPRRIRFEWTT